MSQTQPTQRIQLVDSLRGFALMAIVMLHSIEHYNLFSPIAWQPAWLSALDSAVTEAVWFLFAGKAYATFSLLFGFSFYIQMRNARRRGCDFRARFAWRLLLLGAIAQIHALFYNGDILVFYAICGLILIPASSWSNRTVAIVATVLLLQPIDWIHIVAGLLDPSYVDTNSRFIAFAVQAEQAGMHGNFLQTIADNIGNGQLYSNFWQVEAGRICQTPGLFLMGMLLGRKELFVNTPVSRRFWRNVLCLAIAGAAGLWVVKMWLCALDLGTTWTAHIGIATGLPLNFAVMAIWVSLLTLLWMLSADGLRFQHLSIQYGRMSLTNYISQSIIGVALFYNWGLGLYQYCGATLSALIALAIIAGQTAFSRYWLAGHPQGPLEALWKRLTWLKF